ncbi:hypothetical protein P9B03_19045 [Metasolibacillus meyeri]|uniref:DUF4306 domain-containing protein n=1 Tax=Metasolibacillus meyeri TaxID=1071052 RepID=A0AAW9NS34_9BACL|nr:hypothetical protein [Metasolibacillus meyeri]MEC1180562.1 hypothetical protein [Metasolibacillus meyeri]
MKKKNNEKILFLSIFIIIIISFIPEIGIRIDEGYYFFGFPAQWFVYYGKYQYSFEILGFLFNIVIFYSLFLLLNKISRKFSSNKK